MHGYVSRRVVQMVITLLAFLIVLFFVVRVTGDPAAVIAPVDARNEDIEAIRKELDLDKPLYYQFATYMGDLFTGSLGESIKSKQDVNKLIVEHGINSVKLGVTAIIIGIAAGVPLGIVGAVKRFTIWESISRFVAVVGVSAPSFWLGIVGIYIFAVQFGAVQAGGMGGATSFVLPSIVMSLSLMAGVTRLLRSGMLTALDSDYVRMARMKGLSERRVIWKHALRNAMIPVVGFATVAFALFLTGSVATETVFAWPGIGRLMYDALLIRDFPVLQGAVIAFVAIALLLNLIVDILYAVLDPRIRLS